MKSGKGLDCIVIGYNELPFETYEELIGRYGTDSEAYRDLKFSFVDVAGKKMNYVNLLNHVISLANQDGAGGLKPDFESGDIPNLAAVYLTNFLSNSGFSAKYINLFQQEKERLIEYLAEDPYCVAITTTFYVLNFPVTDIVEFIRKHNSKVKIVVGGPLVSNHARNYEGDGLVAALTDMGADVYVVEGQGELTLAMIVHCLKNRGDLRQVPNLIFLEDGGLHRTRMQPENNSLDVNYIDWGKFSGESLGRTLQTRTARSCAFNCSFCNYPARAGKLTLLGLESFEKELNSMRALGDVKNVVFIDDTFNVPLPRFKEMCRLMIDKEYDFNWYSYFRCSNSDEEAIDLMAKSGCKGVFLGIESGSPQILKNMNKAATPEKYVEGMRLLHDRGVLTFGSFITGFPGETDETVKETIDFINETKPSYFRSQMWYCEPGTPVDHNRQKYDITGEGFVWTHTSMDSLTAMDHIDRMFLTIDSSLWLPQWSFDFWIIPYLTGKGISFERFKQFMTLADRMLALEIAYLSQEEKSAKQKVYLEGMVSIAKTWS